MTKPLSSNHAAFVTEYRADRNGRRAYAAVYGTAGKSAEASARKLLRNPRIAAEMARLDSERAEKLEIDVSKVLLDAVQVLAADTRDLVEFRVGACRHCYGAGHHYQRTVGEFNHDFEKWTGKEGKTAETFDQKGGIGYDPRRPPLDACPECFGAGAGRPLIRDTRHLPANAVRLYAGVKATQFGMQVLTRSQDAARETLMKHLGLYAKDNAQKSTPLGEALRDLVTKFHEESAGRAPVVPFEKIRRVK